MPQLDSRACLYASLPPLFWSGNFLIARIMRDQIPPFQMSFWRWTLAFLIILPFALRSYKQHRETLYREWRYLLLLGAVGVTAYNCFIYNALHYTTVVNASIIASLMPVVTFILALWLLGERIGGRQLAGVVLALLGALAIILEGFSLDISRFGLNPGDLLVVFALTFWSLYTILIRWRRTGLPLLLFLGSTMGFGVLFHLPFIAWEISTRGSFELNLASAASIVYFAVFPSLLAYFFWNRAVGLMGAGRTGMFMYLLPVYGTLLGIIVLREAVYVYHLLGIVMIFSGMVLVTRKT